MSYATLGLDVQQKSRRVVYCLPGELGWSEVVVRAVDADSVHASQMGDDAVNIGNGLLVDRSDFHGSDRVIVLEVHHA